MITLCAVVRSLSVQSPWPAWERPMRAHARQHFWAPALRSGVRQRNPAARRCRACALLALGALLCLALAGPPPARAADPLPDTGAIDAKLESGIQEGLTTAVRDTNASLRDAFLGPIAAHFPIMTSTPPELTTNLPAVRTLHLGMVIAANSILALLVVLSGYRLLVTGMAGARESLGQTVVRLVGAAILVNTALIGADGGWLRWLIDLNNAGVLAFDQMGGASDQAWMPTLLARPEPSAGWLAAAVRSAADAVVTLPVLKLAYSIVVLIQLVVAIVWFLQMLRRHVTLLVLIAVAPLCLVFSALPELRFLTTTWFRLFLPTLVLQIVQWATIVFAVRLRETTPLFSLDTGFLGMLFTIAALSLLLRWPRLLQVGEGGSVARALVQTGSVIAGAARLAGR